VRVAAKDNAATNLDRFLHHAEVITITGRSYRLKNRTTADPCDPKKSQEDPCTEDPK
jgi:hypothetical protein